MCVCICVTWLPVLIPDSAAYQVVVSRLGLWSRLLTAAAAAVSRLAVRKVMVGAIAAAERRFELGLIQEVLELEERDDGRRGGRSRCGRRRRRRRCRGGRRSSGGGGGCIANVLAQRLALRQRLLLLLRLMMMVRVSEVRVLVL